MRKKFLLAILGLLTLVALYFLTQQYLLPHYYASTVQSRILKQYPIMVLISLKSPDEFHDYIEKIKANIIARGDETNNFYFAASLINNEFSRYAAKASDQALYEFLAAEIQLYKGLYHNNPGYVLYIEFPDLFRNTINLDNLNKALNGKDVHGLEIAKETVITSGFENTKLMTFSDEQQNLAAASINIIMNSLNQQYGQALVSASLLTPNKPELDQAKTAEIIISYYEKIYAQGPQRAGDILRVIFATNTAIAAH